MNLKGGGDVDLHNFWYKKFIVLSFSGQSEHTLRNKMQQVCQIGNRTGLS